MLSTFGVLMSLSTLIQEETALDDIAAWLDEQTAEDRLNEVRGLNKSQQRALFEHCKDAQPLTLDDFCGDTNQEVIHEGKNSLPAFTLFQKRFVRLDDNRVVGYNHGSTMGLIGPGYFVLKETQGTPEWTEHGSVVVDYYEVLDGQTTVPTSWPKIKGNHQGLQMFVYNNMHDFMRKVSTHVSIGSAFKKGKSIDSYFLLCRQ
jgi:hypothetical protein